MNLHLTLQVLHRLASFLGGGPTPQLPALSVHVSHIQKVLGAVEKV